MSSPQRRRELERRRQEQDERDAAVAAAKDEQYRYLPASYRAQDELNEALGTGHGQLIRALVDALIQERND